MNRVEVEIRGAEALGSTVKVERAAVGAPSSAERSATPLALPALARASTRPPAVPTGTVADQFDWVVPGAVSTAGLGYGATLQEPVAESHHRPVEPPSWIATLTLLMLEELFADPLIVSFPFGLATVEEFAGDTTAVDTQASP